MVCDNQKCAVSRGFIFVLQVAFQGYLGGSFKGNVVLLVVSLLRGGSIK